MTETVFAATARVYANSGWSVFPLWWIVDGRCACPNGRLSETDKNYCGARSDGTISGSPGKHPITRNGVKDASRNLDTIAPQWARYPLAYIGLPAGDNDLAIIDVDPRKGGDESLAKLRDYAATKDVDLMATLTQHTGGDGLHLVRAAPKGGIKNAANSFGPDMPGLDTRGRGGYIVAWPSGHISGGMYEWVDLSADIAPWPDFLTLLMEPKKLEYVAPMLPAQRGPIGDKYAAAALKKELDILASTRSGRNDQLNISAYSIGQLVGARLIDENVARGELYNAAVANGYVAKDGVRETLNTIKSGLNAGKANPRAGVR